jgi:carbon monoxide dehydrogenase subunit G
MQIENEFVVAAPAEQLWNYLLDVEKIAPCMPGAELTEAIDDRSWRGKLNMKFGPVAMSFAGTVELAERDDEAHRVTLRAKGMEQKGKGAANAVVTSWLEPGDSPETSRVKMNADITLTGAAAQLSRGLLPEISKKLTQQFADCLQTNMAAEAEAVPASTAAGEPAAAPVAAEEPAAAAEEAPAAQRTTAKPVGGIGLGLAAVWAVIKSFFRRLFGGRKSSA